MGGQGTATEEPDINQNVTKGATVGQVGEFGLIDALRERLSQGPGVLLGPGDDAAVVVVPDGRVVATTDVLVENVHFRRDWSSGQDVGVKAAAASLADVAAMGGRATSVVVGLAVPPDLPQAWALDLADGLQSECLRVGASVVGGDIVRSDRVVVSVTALGDLDGREPVTRSGARPGDVVALVGRLGWSAGGLAVLSRGFRSPRVLADAHRRPAPPYDAGPQAALAGATAMCDVSDGLVADLGHIAAASGVRIDVDSSVLDVTEAMRDVSAALNADPREWVLGGGEDHALVATFPDQDAVPDGWLVVGAVSAVEPDREPEVLVDGLPWQGPAGHTHF